MIPKALDPAPSLDRTASVPQRRPRELGLPWGSPTKSMELPHPTNYLVAPTNRKWGPQPGYKWDFLWGQVVHKNNWGELTHKNDPWDEPPSTHLSPNSAAKTPNARETIEKLPKAKGVLRRPRRRARLCLNLEAVSTSRCEAWDFMRIW